MFGGLPTSHTAFAEESLAPPTPTPPTANDVIDSALESAFAIQLHLATMIEAQAPALMGESGTDPLSPAQNEAAWQQSWQDWRAAGLATPPPRFSWRAKVKRYQERYVQRGPGFMTLYVITKALGNAAGVAALIQHRLDIVAALNFAPWNSLLSGAILHVSSRHRRGVVAAMMGEELGMTRVAQELERVHQSLQAIYGPETGHLLWSLTFGENLQNSPLKKLFPPAVPAPLATDGRSRTRLQAWLRKVSLATQPSIPTFLKIGLVLKHLGVNHPLTGEDRDAIARMPDIQTEDSLKGWLDNLPASWSDLQKSLILTNVVIPYFNAVNDHSIDSFDLRVLKISAESLVARSLYQATIRREPDPNLWSGALSDVFPLSDHPANVKNKTNRCLWMLHQISSPFVF